MFETAPEAMTRSLALRFDTPIWSDHRLHLGKQIGEFCRCHNIGQLQVCVGDQEISDSWNFSVAFSYPCLLAAVVEDQRQTLAGDSIFP